MSNELQVFSSDALRTKKGQLNFAQELVSRIKDGDQDALKTVVLLATLENISEAARKELTDLVCDEIRRHGPEAVVHGVSLKLMESGVKWDWEVCNDPELTALLADQKRIAEAVKQRQEFLKQVPKKGMEVVDTDSGEVRTIFPPARSSKSTFSVTFPK